MLIDTSKVLRVIIPSLYTVRSQAAVQIDWTLGIVLAVPQVAYAVLAMGVADLQARAGHLSSDPDENTYTEQGLIHRKVPSFVEYKAKAIKLFNEDVPVSEREDDIPAIAVVMSIIFLEVCLPLGSDVCLLTVLSALSDISRQ